MESQLRRVKRGKGKDEREYYSYWRGGRKALYRKT
jgi:hypothetical protein